MCRVLEYRNNGVKEVSREEITLQALPPLWRNMAAELERHDALLQPYRDELGKALNFLAIARECLNKAAQTLVAIQTRKV